MASEGLATGLDLPNLEIEHRLTVSSKLLNDFGEVNCRPCRIQVLQRTPQRSGPGRDHDVTGTEFTQRPAKCHSFAVVRGLTALPKGFIGSLKSRHRTLDAQVRQGFGRPLANGGVPAVQQADQHVTRQWILQRGEDLNGTQLSERPQTRYCRDQLVQHFWPHSDQRMLGVLCHFARFRVQFADPLGNRAVHAPESGSASPTTATR